MNDNSSRIHIYKTGSPGPATRAAEPQKPLRATSTTSQTTAARPGKPLHFTARPANK
jgi:hypothetical protein